MQQIAMRLLTGPRVRFFGAACALMFCAVLLHQQLMLGSRPIAGGPDAAPTGLFPDFAQFYVAGQLVAEGRADLLYNKEAFWDRTRAVLGTDGAGYWFAYPPFVAWACQPLAALPYRTAAWLFFCANVGGALWLGRRIARHFLPDAPVEARTAMWLLVGSVPFWRCASFGQNGVLSLALVWFFYELWQRAWYKSAGAALALTLFKPQLFLGLYAWLLLFGTQPALVGFTAGTMLLAWIGTAVAPQLHLWSAWWNSLQAVWLLPEYPAWMHSFMDLWRTLAGIQLPMFWVWVKLMAWAALASVWLGTLVHRRALRWPGDGEMLGLALAGSLLLAPRLYQYDMLLAYPLLIGWWAQARLEPKSRNAARSWLAAFYLVLMLSDPLGRLKIPAATVLALWLFILWTVKIVRDRPASRRR